MSHRKCHTTEQVATPHFITYLMLLKYVTNFQICKHKPGNVWYVVSMPKNKNHNI
jgi:hypothetical protein